MGWSKAGVWMPDRAGGWSNKIPAVAPSYTGPGDVMSGAAHWYGMYAYNASKIGSNAVDIKRASDSTTQTFTYQSNGIVSGSAIASFLASTSGVITNLYDNIGTDDVSSSTHFPILGLNSLGSIPAIRTTNAGVEAINSTGNFATPIAQPCTIAAVAARKNGQISLGQICGDGTAPGLFFDSTSGKIACFAGSAIPDFTGTATEGNFHSLQVVLNDASSIGSINGSSAVLPSSPGTSGINSTSVGASGSYVCDMDLIGFGFWTGDQSAKFAAMSANDHSLLGF